MFNREILEEIKSKTREINKMKTLDERVQAITAFRDGLYLRINDEMDEQLSNINLKTVKEE